MTLYYWATNDKNSQLCYGDTRKAKVGVSHSVVGNISMCSHGLHACKRLNYVFHYRYFPKHIYIVSLEGSVQHVEDKSVARKRTYLAKIDLLAMVNTNDGILRIGQELIRLGKKYKHSNKSIHEWSKSDRHKHNKLVAELSENCEFDPDNKGHMDLLKKRVAAELKQLKARGIT